jgi:hypothetical protein
MPLPSDSIHLRLRLKILAEHAQDVRKSLKAEEDADMRRDQHRAMAIVYLGHAVDALDCAASELAAPPAQ